MTVKQLDFKKKCWYPFGTYVQAHANRNVTNQIIDQNQGTIYQGPTGNLQVTYAFLSLRTERKITRSQCTELPTPPCVT